MLILESIWEGILYQVDPDPDPGFQKKQTLDL